MGLFSKPTPARESGRDHLIEFEGGGPCDGTKISASKPPTPTLYVYFRGRKWVFRRTRPSSSVTGDQPCHIYERWTVKRGQTQTRHVYLYQGSEL